MITLYADASLSTEASIAVAGYMLVRNEQMVCHRLYVLDGIKNIGDAERYAIFFGLRDLEPQPAGTKINIYTDHLGILTSKRRIKGHDSNRQLWTAVNTLAACQVECIFYHIRSHTHYESRTPQQRWHAQVDRAARRELRLHLKRKL